ncbi:unnamed protein product [marine sediment metagenome]|uniref:Uncharacterized protein n=1 Tax=marine sediment metagenome TaxID=412755 RepID=X1AZL6_9ZZZZ
MNKKEKEYPTKEASVETESLVTPGSQAEKEVIKFFVEHPFHSYTKEQLNEFMERDVTTEINYLYANDCLTVTALDRDIAP